MNELFAAEPTCCNTVESLRLLLKLFGPYSGRYIAACPEDWRSKIEENFRHLPHGEMLRVRRALQKAKQEKAYVNDPALYKQFWDEELHWVDNALTLASNRPPQINNIITSASSTRLGTLSFDDLMDDLSPTADEDILAEPKEYVRVCKTLMVISEELYFVDPNLNPCKNDNYYKVLVEVLSTALDSGCKTIVCFASSKVVGDRTRYSWKDIEEGWTSLLEQVKWPTDRRFEYYLANEDQQDNKMHRRYVLSSKGGIRLEYGFQIPKVGQRVDISPIGKQLHDGLWRTYKDLWQIFQEDKDSPIINHRFLFNQQ